MKENNKTMNRNYGDKRKQKEHKGGNKTKINNRKSSKK